MMVKDGIPYVMEINTLPGMTRVYYQKVQLQRIEYSKLLDMIIETSLRVRKDEGF